MLRRSRSRLAACAGVACAVLAIASTSAAASAAITAGRSGTAGGTPVQVTGTHLTAAQENALAAAVKANPGLTAAQAATVIGSSSAARGGQAIPDAQGTSKGPCGSISLIGYPSGTYGYAMFWNTAAVGSPWFGSLTVSTNGINASDDVYGIPPNSGSGFLDDVGDEPTGTQANGWAVTSGGWYCGISVFAEW